MIRPQAHEARIDLDISARKVEVVRTTVSQAQENLRIPQPPFAQDANTSTEVLDAETLLARGRTNSANAEHANERARVALRHAAGSPPAPPAARGRRR